MLDALRESVVEGTVRRTIKRMENCSVDGFSARAGKIFHPLLFALSLSHSLCIVFRNEIDARV